MSQSLVEMAKDLVLAQVRAGRVPPNDMPSVLKQTYSTLIGLNRPTFIDIRPTAQGSQPVLVEPINWRKSIRKYSITCLECGASFKQLSSRHLQKHGLNVHSYRENHGIPTSTPLSSKETAQRRRAIIREVRPWEKAPTYLQPRSSKQPEVPKPKTPQKADVSPIRGHRRRA